MRKYLAGAATVALSMAIGACGTESAENADVNAEANTEVLVDENAAMDANVVMDANAMDANAMDANAVDANATADADAATNNASE